jgi:hypothetical protein
MAASILRDLGRGGPTAVTGPGVCSIEDIYIYLYIYIYFFFFARVYTQSHLYY